jgi:pimeloyl-ACP methyl ester carboxylesterase
VSDTDDQLTHRFVETGDVQRIHVVERGEGPLVLLLHGFPDTWRGWRHQLRGLADAGFRAVALDLRGCGQSSRPEQVEAYRMLLNVADCLTVVDALGERTACIVGHDVGSPVAGTAALVRPDVFDRVALLGVPYAPPGGPRPTSVLAFAGGDEQFYVNYFQQVGPIEQEIEADPRAWLAGFYSALSEPGHEDVFTIPTGGRMRDRFPAGEPPRWLDANDLEAQTEELARLGVTGALNRYRNIDRDWEDLAVRRGLPLRQPSLFVAGSRDASVQWMAGAIEAFPQTMPGLVQSVLIDDAGHWVHQERPDEVNAVLIDFLRRTT